MTVRKTLTTIALTVGALGVATTAANAANADPMDHHNEHSNVFEKHGTNVIISDVLTNTDVLGGGINVTNVQVLGHHNTN